MKKTVEMLVDYPYEGPFGEDLVLKKGERLKVTLLAEDDADDYKVLVGVEELFFREGEEVKTIKEEDNMKAITTITDLYNDGLITATMVSNADRDGIEEIHDLDELLEIKGIGPARIEKIREALEAAEETDDSDNTPTSDEAAETAPEASDDVLIKDFHAKNVDLKKVIAKFYTSQAVKIDDELMLGDVFVTKSNNSLVILEVSYLEDKGELVYNSKGGFVTSEEWDIIRFALLREYSQYKSDPEEEVLSGDRLAYISNYGVRGARVKDVQYTPELSEGDYVALLEVKLKDHSVVMGEAFYTESGLVVNYMDLLSKKEVNIPQEVTDKLIEEVRVRYASLQRAANSNSEDSVSVSTNNHITDKSSNQENNSQANPNRFTQAAHGLDQYDIRKLRPNLDGITNGTPLAECYLKYGDNEALFVAVFYDGALRFFEKHGNRQIKMDTTRQFLTDQIRSAYVNA